MRKRTTPPRPHRAVVIASLVLVTALAACRSGASPGAEGSVGGSPTEGPPTPGTSLTACEIVTANDIGQVLLTATGERNDVADGTLAESPNALSPGHASCSYAGGWGELEVDVTPDDGADLYAAALAAADDAQPLEIGDGAFWSPDTARGFFWKGSVTVMLQFSGLGRGVDVRDATVAIGRRALKGL